MKRLIFPPIELEEGGRRPFWSVNVDLPAEVDTEIRRYVQQDDLASRTLMIHSALYIYRAHFWTKEELDAEFREVIDERIRSAEEKGTIEVTPQFWKDFRKRNRRTLKLFDQLTKDGKMGNLLLPKELYAFVLERIDAGPCKTPTDVVCAALPYLREARKKKRQKAATPVPEALRIIGEESRLKGTDTLSSEAIDDTVRKTRKARRASRKPAEMPRKRR